MDALVAVNDISLHLMHQGADNGSNIVSIRDLFNCLLDLDIGVTRADQTDSSLSGGVGGLKSSSARTADGGSVLVS